MNTVHDVEQSKSLIMDELRNIEVSANSDEERAGAKAFGNLFRSLMADPSRASSAAGKIAQITAEGILDREYSSVDELRKSLGDKFEFVVE